MGDGNGWGIRGNWLATQIGQINTTLDVIVFIGFRSPNGNQPLWNGGRTLRCTIGFGVLRWGNREGDKHKKSEQRNDGDTKICWDYIDYAHSSVINKTIFVYSVFHANPHSLPTSWYSCYVPFCSVLCIVPQGCNDLSNKRHRVFNVFACVQSKVIIYYIRYSHPLLVSRVHLIHATHDGGKAHSNTVDLLF